MVPGIAVTGGDPGARSTRPAWGLPRELTHESRSTYTGDSDLSHMAANSHQGPKEKRCGEHGAFARWCAGGLTLALQAVADPP